MNEQKRSKTAGLAALLLLCVFAVLILLVLLTGADTYRRLVERDEASYDRRTVAQYVATRVRQADRVGGVAVEPFGDGDALALRETVDGTVYLTRIYCREGWLYELFTADEAGFSPEDGEKLLPLERLELALEDGVLRVDAGDQALLFALRSGEEAGS